jgi:hypothetical protein
MLQTLSGAGKRPGLTMAGTGIAIHCSRRRSPLALEREEKPPRRAELDRRTCGLAGRGSKNQNRFDRPPRQQPSREGRTGSDPL